MSAVYMLNSVGERMPPCGTPVLIDVVRMFVISICWVGFASLDVVCDELNDCAWNVGLEVSFHTLK